MERVRPAHLVPSCLLVLGGLGPAPGCAESAGDVSPRASATEAQAGLRAAFPAHAPRVLGELEGAGFVATDEGFELAEPGSPFGLGRVTLPRDGGAAALITAPQGFEVRVHEVGVSGEGALAGRSVAYRRTRGSSFWSVAPGGAEEWIHLPAGAVRRGEIAATWEVAGATPEERGDAVALVDGHGSARVWVTAPEAYAASGRRLDVRLSVREGRIDLHVDTGGEEALVDPVWTATGPGPSSGGPALVTLADGRALLVGGGSVANAVSAAHVYNATSNIWSPAGNMSTGRWLPTATLLPSGLVIVAGGQSVDAVNQPYQPLDAELYDPTAGTWSPGGTMPAGGRLASAVRLANGQVLFAGGYDVSGAAQATASLYDPVANTWAPATPMNVPHAGQAMALLQTGKVLVAGGYSGGSPVATSEVYDPTLDTWTLVADLTLTRAQPAAIALPNGNVLVAGGKGLGFTDSGAEVYDPVANSWTYTVANQIRIGGSATLLTNGTVLIAGGEDTVTVPIFGVQIFTPWTFGWSSGGAVPHFHRNAVTTRLGNGDVIVASSQNPDRYWTQSPLGAACSTASQCASGFCVDAVCCTTAACTAADTCHAAGTCQAGTGVCSSPTLGNSTPCDDGNACTQIDYCQGGTCIGTSPIACPSIPCHSANTCNSMTGMCQAAAQPDGTPCSVSNFCWAGPPTCVAGVCTSALTTCPAAGPCTDPGVCDPVTQTCSPTKKQDGTSCDDGDACTQIDTCNDGVCEGASAVACQPEDECHDAGTCNKGTGLCDNPEKPDGTPCSAGHCEEGVCVNPSSSSSSSTSSSSSSSSTSSSSSSSSSTSSSSGADGGAGTGGAGGAPHEEPRLVQSAGCGCHTSGDDPAPMTALPALALAALLRVRRNKR